MAGKTVSQAKANTEGSFETICGSIINSVISIFLLIVFFVFPLIFDNYYFNILETKYHFYRGAAVGVLALAAALSLIFLFVDLVEYKGEKTKGLFAKLLPGRWKETSQVADAAVLVFLLVCIISTLQSEYKQEAFWGTSGRYTGLFLTFLYVAVYFLISRFWRMKGWYLEVFLISGMLVCLLGVTDYFQLDLLHFRTNIQESQAATFASTIGNINTYTAYVSLVMGFAAAMYVTAETTAKTIWYYICMVVSFFAIIMGCSDNAYLAIGALFAFIPLLLFEKKGGVGRYLVMLASFFSVIQCIALINVCLEDTVIGLDSLFQVIATGKALVLLVVALWAIAGLFIYLLKKHQTIEGGLNKKILYGWGMFLGVVFLIICYVLYDVNIVGNIERYGAISGYLRFDDSWGTNRGYIWRKSLEVFRQFPFIKKLVGHGPDTFGILTKSTFYEEMVLATGQEFDSAHNEYLQFLVTVGALGLISYLVFVISSCWKMVKCVNKNPYICGVLWAVVCYLVQAVVNINLPVVTPMMWLLLSCGVATCKKVDNIK